MDLVADVSLVAGIAGTVLFVVTFLLDGLTRPGYDPVRHPVSALALGGRGWVQTANFLVSGLLVTAAAPGLHAATGSGWLAASVAVFGLALLASGVFPMDPMRGYPPGTPDVTPTTYSRRHQVHDWAGVVVFGSLPVAALAAALALDDRRWAVLSGAAAAGLVVLFLWFGSAWERDSPRAGLVQRAYIIVGWAWLGALCWHLLP
ncbi:DUF998 domain-containing protein [Micromonospora craterilacus]|uniref:DUF998 domain-containing protein n=1 Tax=Micromonospora craterilacus TaxID=1655439 RepID=A0A2W2EX45_9ACTN|nr:DUF998 domain-containing protein [Micromonospora craterilacus]PZG20835.1 DUF998 domain-containing protein [Micromonospora craterilacus]